MIYPVVRELAADGVPVATACRVLQVSASGFYDWLDREPPARERADAALTETIAAVHAASYGTYGTSGAPRLLRHLRPLRGPPGARRTPPRPEHSGRPQASGAADAPPPAAGSAPAP